jgi:hypothetical protein
MFDIKQVIKEAEDEVREDRMAAAKKRVKQSLRTIASAEEVLTNAKREHEVLLASIAG